MGVDLIPIGFAKGDVAGHPFHGNQHTGGIGGGGGSSLASINVDKLLADNPPHPGEPVFAYQSRVVSSLPPAIKHEVLYRIRENYTPVDYIAAGAAAFRASHGLPQPQIDISQVKADQAKADKVGVAFEGMSDNSTNPKVIAAFADFKRQNEEQWKLVTNPVSKGGLGIKVDFIHASDGEPYNSAFAQAEDLRQNHHIYIQSGLGGDHTLMSTKQYDQFRAVHDVFGHAAIGGGFDRHGEYQGWLSHMSMYTGEGAKAMASEYHGVNSSMWAGAPGAAGTGKSVLLPSELIHNPWDEHGNLVRKVVDGVSDSIDELINRLHLDHAFIAQYERGPWHPQPSSPLSLVVKMIPIALS